MRRHQVNPLAEDAHGSLIAADAKLGFDDNASFRQLSLFQLKDASQQDPRYMTCSLIVRQCVRKHRI